MPTAIVDQISQLSSIVDLLLVSPETVLLRDTYFDTTDRQLSAGKVALRLREVGGRCLIGLKGPEEPAADGMKRMEHEAIWTPMALTTVLQLIADYGIPVSKSQAAGLTENPVCVIEGLGLKPVQVRDTERLRRDLVDRSEQSTAIAELVVDSVSYHLPGRVIAHHEVEIELKSSGDTEVLGAVCRELQGSWRELIPWLHSKYATGWAAERLLAAGILTDHIAASGQLRPSAYRLIADWLSAPRA
jgi:inorganic triphosphatase YgiF